MPTTLRSIIPRPAKTGVKTPGIPGPTHTKGRGGGHGLILVKNVIVCQGDMVKRRMNFVKSWRNS